MRKEFPIINGRWAISATLWEKAMLFRQSFASSDEHLGATATSSELSNEAWSG